MMDIGVRACWTCTMNDRDIGVRRVTGVLQAIGNTLLHRLARMFDLDHVHSPLVGPLALCGWQAGHSLVDWASLTLRAGFVDRPATANTNSLDWVSDAIRRRVTATKIDRIAAVIRFAATRRRDVITLSAAVLR